MVIPCTAGAQKEIMLMPMTHVQELFIRNLRFLRNKKNISQVKLSEMVNISPNYLNAVENGKNFPSPEVLQHISDSLGILPYQLFLEQPAGEGPSPASVLTWELTALKQRLVGEIDAFMKGLEE
ncbi:MAG: helix-turn-helix domain-containing protein [Treponema sp.]|jgi:transcriptional regulator with XRE-family HTH domain|nr:helix-turn-helix domain-containing protein [Treponema sp.]